MIINHSCEKAWPHLAGADSRTSSLPATLVPRSVALLVFPHFLLKFGFAEFVNASPYCPSPCPNPC